MPTLPTEWTDLNAIQRDILTVLAIHGPTTGSDVNDALGRDPENRSWTHRNLVTLRKQGFVASTEVDDCTQRNELTEDGWALVNEGVIEVAKRVRPEATV